MAITSVRDIRTENPAAQVWKLLRFYLDSDVTAERMRVAQGLGSEVGARNLKKQARQVAYCIRQAEEYFRASSQVGIATRPVLLYYGAVSLSRAVVLMRRDGNHSLDAMRKADRHRHHGLNLNRGKLDDATKAKGPEAFFSAIEATVHRHPESGEPWGHFGVFYASLVQGCVFIEQEMTRSDRPLSLRMPRHQPCADLVPISDVAARPLTVLPLLKTLPDLYWGLRPLGVLADICRGSWHTSSHEERGEQGHRSSQLAFRWYVDGVSPHQRDELVGFLTSKNPLIKVMRDDGRNLAFSLDITTTPTELGPPLGHLPDVVDDLMGQLFYIVCPAEYVPQEAALLAVLFCFSMLARYFPDVWMARIDGDTRTAEVIDAFLNVCYRKFPNLMLDQLSDIKHYIHL